jgi:hypothetical protein
VGTNGTCESGAFTGHPPESKDPLWGKSFG